MLGKQNPQTSFLDLESWFVKPIVDSGSIYAMMAQWGTQLICEDDFAELYSATGRPSISPGLLAKVLLLMYHDNVSDREAEQRAQYDLRWKLALRLPMDESGFDYTALCRFRARLLINQQQKLIFTRFVNLAHEAGIIKEKSLQIIDSTHVLGAAAVQDTYTLIKTAIQKLLRISRRKNGRAIQAFNRLTLSLDYNKKDKENILWDDKVARQKLLNQLVNDSRALRQAIEAEPEMELSEEEKAALELLSAITEQDIEPAAAGEVKIKQGVAKDRIISAHDPEMRHGHKTSKGKFNGHKAQIMTDEASEIITNISVTPGNEADGSALLEILQQSAVKPQILLGDTAYGTLDARDTMESQNVVPVAPLPMGGHKAGHFGKQDFVIDFEQNSCRCPAGVVTNRVRKSDDVISAYVFLPKTCSQCDLRDQCTQPGKGRVIGVHPQEERRQEIIKQNETEEFKKFYKRRAQCERKNAHLVRRGMRKSRYIGKAKTLIQVAFTAAVVNLKRLFTIVKGNLCALQRLETSITSG
jgi:transposase